MKKLSILILILYSYNCISQCSHNVHRPVAVGGEIYKPSGYPGVMPGDTIKILEGNYDGIEIDQLHGTYGCPITIIDSGLVTVSDYFRFKTGDSCIRITGTGWAGHTYGFVLECPPAIDYGNHIEIDHLDVTSAAGVGMYIKCIPDTLVPITVYLNSTSYRLNKFYIHHNYIHDIGGEGMYLGSTGPCDGQNGYYPNGDPILPLRMDSVEVAHNIVINTEWDGIQLSNARNGCSIHDNYVYNFGTINMGSQQAGIIAGGNTNTQVYNNTIRKGTGNGLEVFGYGTMNIYNNTIDSTGDDGTMTGQASFFSNDPHSCPEPWVNQQLNLYNNHIDHPQTFGAIRMQNDNEATQPVDAADVHDNTFCIPGADPMTWESDYIFFSGSGGSLSGNSLICYVPPTQYSPFCSAGLDQLITLPKVPTLLGSATPGSSPITGWAWSKTLGQAAVITTPNSPQTTVTGLQQGVYKFDLKVTDSRGLTARDTMQLTVNAAPAPPPVIDSNTITVTWEKNNNRFKFLWDVKYKDVKILGVQFSTDGVNFSNLNWTTTKYGYSYKNTSYNKIWMRTLVLLNSGKYNYSLTKSAIKT